MRNLKLAAIASTVGAAMTATAASAQSATQTALTGVDFTGDMEAAIPLIIGALVVLVGFRYVKRIL